MKVERSLQNAKAFLFVEHSYGEEVADLEDEAAGFLQQRRLSVVDVLPQNDGLLLTRQMRPQTGKRFLRILGKLGERSSEFPRGLKSLVKHYVIDRQGKERVGLAAEVGDAVFDRGINDRIAVKLVGDGLVVALEEVLVDAVVFIEELQSRLKTLAE